MARQLRQVGADCGPSQWRGHAATAFHAYQLELPHNADQVAAGYEDVEVALDEYGRALEELRAAASAWPSVPASSTGATTSPTASPGRGTP